MSMAAARGRRRRRRRTMQGNEAMAPEDLEDCRFIVDERSERECDGLNWGWLVL